MMGKLDMRNILIRECYQQRLHSLMLRSPRLGNIRSTVRCFQLVNISLLGITAHPSRMRPSCNSYTVSPFNWRRHVFIYGCLVHPRLRLRRMSLSSIIIVSRLISSIPHVLSQITPRDQSFNLILQLSALVCGVPPVSVIPAVLVEIPLVFGSPQGIGLSERYILLICQENLLPRLIQLDMYLI